MLPEGSVIVASTRLGEIEGGSRTSRLPYDAHVDGAINLDEWECDERGGSGFFERIVIDPDGEFWAYFETSKLGPFGLRQINEDIAHIKIREMQE